MDRDQIVIDLLNDGTDMATIMEESGYKKSKIYEIKKNKVKNIAKIEDSISNIQLDEINSYEWSTTFTNFINTHSTTILICTGCILLILVVVVICLIVSEQSRTKQLYDDVNESVKALTNAKLKAEEERDQAIKERNKIVKIKDEELLLKDQEIKKTRRFDKEDNTS